MTAIVLVLLGSPFKFLNILSNCFVSSSSLFGNANPCLLLSKFNMGFSIFGCTLLKSLLGLYSLFLILSNCLPIVAKH